VRDRKKWVGKVDKRLVRRNALVAIGAMVDELRNGRAGLFCSGILQSTVAIQAQKGKRNGRLMTVLVVVVVRNQGAGERNGWVVFLLDKKPRVSEVCTLIHYLHAPESDCRCAVLYYTIKLFGALGEERAILDCDKEIL
jgi:hypothetical protein